VGILQQQRPQRQWNVLTASLNVFSSSRKIAFNVGDRKKQCLWPFGVSLGEDLQIINILSR